MFDVFFCGHCGTEFDTFREWDDHWRQFEDDDDEDDDDEDDDEEENV